MKFHAFLTTEVVEDRGGSLPGGKADHSLPSTLPNMSSRRGA
jgi:hypothetical protein